ncbi:PIG-L family deacetylase [Lysinibacillus sp. OL1_EC]|uniref:PIG-L deacetylase family protein n=1 Tax=unclassified Lysinibacillus TaxID=2636778 RepID=UPI00103C5AC1|nr:MULTISPECIES: PIG-L deacetylase family protein [unclassified Lysinibacillus]MCM0626387.1 PIG-L family deacetylase [Lysinibacillus sp. OL1_EC]TBV85745.1 PIG-L family deacetylase [Lysinibacillus sp. OL1]
MKNILIVAPHPDDEVLGCGGTILRHKAGEDKVHWLIMTHILQEQGFSEKKIKKREEEIDKVSREFVFDSVHHLKFPTAELDRVPIGDLVDSIGNVIKLTKAQIIYVPYRADIHSDHKAVFDATMACTKWFRYPTVEKVLAYETLSETDFTINPDANTFRPNVFVNIEAYLDKKIEIMNIYESEISEFPFPRSEKAIRSMAHVRGAASGFEAAEAFMLLKERDL